MAIDEAQWALCHVGAIARSHRFDATVQAFVGVRTELQFAIRALTRLVPGSSLAGAITAGL
jgi:hypothetical protein